MIGGYFISRVGFRWLLGLLLIVLVQTARAQQCPPNMLYLAGEESGYARVMDRSELRLDKAFTVESWIKVAAAVDRSTIIEKGNGNEFVNYSLALGSFSTVVARVLSPTGVITLTSESILEIGNWHHVALVYRPGDSLTLYVDGQYSSAIRTNANFLVTGTDSLRIGRSIQPGGKPFLGSIDEVRIWKVARTETEIRNTMDSVIPNSSTGLSAYFTFDDDPTSGRIYDNMRMGVFAELREGAQIIPSTSPVQKRGTVYKLQAKELDIRLPRMGCTSRVDTVVRVRNLGMDSVNLNYLGLTYGTTFSVAGPERLVLPADSNFWGEIRVQFNPTGSGVYKDTLIIWSESACAGILRIPLVDTVVAAQIEVTPKSIVIPKTLSCAFPVDRTVTIKNTGPVALRVNRAEFEQEIGARIVEEDQLPIALSPGESRNVTLRFGEGLDGKQETTVQFGIDQCASSASVAVSITREVIAFDVPDRVEFDPRTLFGQVVADTVIIFTNNSARDLLVTKVELPQNSNFKLRYSITNVGVAAGASLSIPVDFTAGACGNYNARLRIYGVPCGIDTSIPVSMTVLSPQPEFASVLDVGFACSAKDTFVVIRNPYDRPIVFSGYTMSDPSAFSLTHFPLAIAPHSDTTITVRFHPSVEKEYNTTLTLNNGSCGASVIILRGGFGTKALVYDRPSVDFGGGCTIKNVTRVFAITNTSPRPVTLTKANVSGTDRYRFKELSLPVTIDAGSSKSFEVEFTPELGHLTQGFAHFTTREDCETEPIELYGSRESVNLFFEETNIDFDTVCPTSSSMLPVNVANNGIDSVRLEYVRVTGEGFSLYEEPSALKLGQNTIKVKFAPPSQGDYLGTLTVKPENCDNIYLVHLRGSGGSNPTLTLSMQALEFESIRVGEGRSMCIDISNSSCVPLTLSSSSFTFTDPAFYLAPETADMLPLTLNSGMVQQICIIYRPEERGANDDILSIEVPGADVSLLTLSGRGVAPLLEVQESVLDFGFVPLETGKPLLLHVKNVGDATALLTVDINQSAACYSINPADVLLEPEDSLPLEIIFTPEIQTVYQSVLTLGEPGYQQQVDLRGVGTARGLVVDRTILEYGDVRLNTSVSEVLHITANTPVTLKGFEVPDGALHYSVTFNKLLPLYLTEDSEVIATVTFTPKTEGDIAGRLTLVDDLVEADPSIPLVGTGVEAHIETESVIDFSVVGFEDVEWRDYTITNVGSFPLTVSSVATTLPFFADPVSSLEIMPGRSEILRVGFSPRVEKEVRGYLRITSDAAEGEQRILLIGRGGPMTQSKPRIAYHVPNVETQIGMHPLIPIKVSGTQLDKIVSDSFMIKLRYDPWMLYLYDYNNFGTLASGFNITMEHEDDSTIVITGSGSQLNLREGATLINLSGEALFGPRPRTTMQIVEAYPSTISTLASAIGELYITNCDDQEAGALFKGAYSVEQVFPNPVKEQATMQYTLGFQGSADVTLHDALGRVVKTVALPEKPKGEHSFELDLRDLPNGQYTGLFRSREFIKHIHFIVQH